MTFKSIKPLILILLIPLFVFLVLIIYVENMAAKSSVGLPIEYKNDIDEIFFNKLNTINQKENNGLYTISTISGENDNSSLFIAKYYVKSDWKIQIHKGDSQFFSILKSYDSNKADEFTLNGVFNINYVSPIKIIDLYVKDYYQISQNLYKCNSRYFYMVLNKQNTTQGIFRNNDFYIQILKKKDYIFLCIFSSSSKEELEIFKSVLK